MARYQQTGTAWELGLSHQEVQIARGGGDVASFVVAAGVPPGISAAVIGAIQGVSEVLRVVDAIGGDRGVNLVGIFFTQAVTVTPAFVSPLDLFSSLAERVQHASGLPGGIVGAGLGAGITWLAAGPAVAALGGLAGYLGTVWDDGPQAGDVHADRREALSWERFTLFALNPDLFAILSWRGYFSADNGGGAGVHAHRDAIGNWERFHLHHNSDGTVSFRHPGGHFLVAERGGGDHSFCMWNRTAIGEWEKFWKVDHPDGTFSLKTFVHGTYVSVQ